MKTIRCFLAIDVADELSGALGAVIQGLAVHADGVKWVEPDDFHLTLKFFGDIDELETYEISKRVNRAIQQEEPFEIDVRGVGAFPRVERPRTLWAGIAEGAERIVRLQDRVESELESLGFRRERRRFHPHITLGRVRSGSTESLTSALREWQDVDIGKAHVADIKLFQSQLHRRGPEYTVLATCPL